MEANELLIEIVNRECLIDAVFSSPKNAEAAKKVSMRPLLIKGQRMYQAAEHFAQKVLHRNFSPKEFQEFILQKLLEYKQGVFFTADHDYYLLVNKKGAIKVLQKPSTKKTAEMSHNKPKNYLIAEGKPIPFLIELGLMNRFGRILPQKYDKFRQINRFLEMVEDVLNHFSGRKQIQIIDFGCGKAYLTFALYYYLNEIKGFDAHIMGIDLKKDVIEYCRNLALQLGCEKLQFQAGQIGDYQFSGRVDMVVALHACDTATDEAIAQAVRWDAAVILAAPCCQHELYHQIACLSLDALLRHGILKERIAALVTDAARAELLEMEGYATQILEFIDSEHTPKNLMIRAVKGNAKIKQEQAAKRYQEFKTLLNINPALDKLIRLKK